MHAPWHALPGTKWIGRPAIEPLPRQVRGTPCASVLKAAGASCTGVILVKCVHAKYPEPGSKHPREQAAFVDYSHAGPWSISSLGSSSATLVSQSADAAGSGSYGLLLTAEDAQQIVIQGPAINIKAGM